MYFSRQLSKWTPVARARWGLIRGALPPWTSEMALLYALLLLVEFVLPGHARLAAMNPHPFWIPVLLLSTQYGVGAGLSAAVVAILLGGVIGCPPRWGPRTSMTTRGEFGGSQFYGLVRQLCSGACAFSRLTSQRP